MIVRFVVFFVVLLSLLGAIDWFVHKRLALVFALSPRARQILGGLLVGGLVAMVGSRVLGKTWPSPLVEGLGVLGAGIQLAALVAFAVLVLERLAAALLRGATWLARRGERPVTVGSGVALATAEAVTTAKESLLEQEAAEPREADAPTTRSDDEAPVLGRRQLFERAAGLAAVTLGTGSAGYGAVYGRHDYVIEEVPVRLDKLPVGLDGFTIVQLSDVHLGLFVGDQEIESMMELVARAKPDLIALTGDLIDSDPRYMDALGRMARRLGEKAPVVAAPGNHDYYAGIGPSLDTLRRAGVNVLVNAAHHPSPRHEGLAVLGVDDMWSRRYGEGRGPDVERAAADLDPDAPRILLCHNPAYFAEAAPHVDLQISGHTHGGQFNPGVRPADLVLPYGYVAGRYERDGAVLWVNRGFGTAGPPSRLGSAPEVTRIVLTS